MLLLRRRSIVFMPFLVLLTCCMAARVDIKKHPDYLFNPTNPGAVMLYDGFIPKNEFIIIGQLNFKKTKWDSIKKTMQVVYSKAAQIGGDAVLLSHTEIKWGSYNRAVTKGSANVYDYGYSFYGTWQQTTNAVQIPIQTAKYYWLYVLRWKNRENIKEPEPGKPLPAITSTSAARVQGQFSPALAEIELREIEASFSQGQYNLAAEKLAKLKNSIDSAIKFNRRNEYLARVHFFWGVYYVMVNKTPIAIEHFNDVLKLDNEFRFNPGQFDNKVAGLFEQVKGSLVEKPSEGEKIEQKAEEVLKIEGGDKQIFVKGSQIRVIKENAVLKVEPDRESLSIRSLPLGALLTVEAQVGAWVKIRLPPDDSGIIIMGYVHASFLKPESE